MTTIIFTYNNKNTIIQCKDEDNIKEIFERFCTKAGLDINSVYFLYDGNSLNNNLSVSQVACKRDKLTKSMNILVNESDQIDNNPSIIESKEVICPKCKEICLLNIIDYKKRNIHDNIRQYNNRRNSEPKYSYDNTPNLNFYKDRNISSHGKSNTAASTLNKYYNITSSKESNKIINQNVKESSVFKLNPYNSYKINSSRSG